MAPWQCTRMESLNGFTVGMVTCTKEAFLSCSSLSYIVHGKIAIVLDRQSVDTGQIIGLLCEGDVACPSMLDQSWIMLAQGSWVRHPKMRNGRIKLQRDGWVAIRHEAYGELLGVISGGKVRALFDEKGFAKVPIVKAAKRQVAQQAEADATEPAAGPEEQSSTPVELLPEHMKHCVAEHWEVVHESANVRAEAKRNAALLATLRQGNVICLGAAGGSSPDGKWARCATDAKLWKSWEDRCPRLLLPLSAAEGFVLKDTEEHVILKRVDPPPKPAKRKEKAAYDEDPSGVELRIRLANEDYWAILQSDLGVHEERSEASEAQFYMNRDDILFVSGQEEPSIWQLAARRWLLVPAGAHVVRKGEYVHTFERRGFALVQDKKEVYAERARDPGFTAVIRVLPACGEPMKVLQQADVRSQPGGESLMLGKLREGSVVGTSTRLGDWVELVHESKIHAVDGLAEVAEVAFEINRATTGEAAFVSGRGEEVRQVWHADWESRAWAPASSLAPQGEPALSSGTLRADRQQMYVEVLSLCRQRIYLENLNTLWEGDRSKLPSLESLESKLFHPSSRVMHVSRQGKFVAGAVLKELSVRGASICYIDMCAAQPRSHGGSDVWEALKSMGYACITCHPVLVQGTVDFWQGKGMRKFESSTEKDCEEFRRQIWATSGVKLELTEVEACLPQSKLPLFVFVSSQFVKSRTRLT